MFRPYKDIIRYYYYKKKLKRLCTIKHYFLNIFYKYKYLRWPSKTNTRTFWYQRTVKAEAWLSVLIYFLLQPSVKEWISGPWQRYIVTYRQTQQVKQIQCTISFLAHPSVRAVYGVGLRPLTSWGCGFESRRGNVCLSLVSVVCCQIQDSASGWSLVQRRPYDCGMSGCDREASIMRKPWSTRGLPCHQ